MDGAENGSEAIPPLRKRKVGGYRALYMREDKVERLLELLVTLPPEEALARAAIRGRKAPGWLPGECLVHMLRRTARDGEEGHYRRWYELVARRVLARYARQEGQAPISALDERIRDHVSGRLVTLLASDRREYDERLDFWEVHFDTAVLNLRRDALRKYLPESQVTQSTDEDNDPAAEAGEPGTPFDPFDSARNNEKDFRSRVWAAIDALPPEQKGIVVMRGNGIPIESSEEGVETISARLGKTPRMVRILQARAFESIRRAVEGEAE